MKILIFTSSSGSTAEYVIHKIAMFSQENKEIEIGALVYEPNEELECRFTGFKRYDIILGRFEYIKVNRNEFITNEIFHNSIWEKILITCDINKKNINLIMLLGWMHIIPKTFIERCNNIGIDIVNLHPTLQYQLIGKNIYPKIWNMYQDGMIKETGCMVHLVSEKLDRGSLIHQLKLNLNSCRDFDDYVEIMYGSNKCIGLEKECVWQALLKLNQLFNSKNIIKKNITPTIMASGDKDTGGLTLKHCGKVRDIYESADYPKYLFVHTSDRISANGMVVSYLLGKSILLNQINIFWHKLLGIREMVTSSSGGMMVIRKMSTIPLKIIIQKRLMGSLWNDYSQNGLRVINGYKLKEGMMYGDIFDELLIIPKTKGTRRIPISFKDIINNGILNRSEVCEIKVKSIQLFLQGYAYMNQIGIDMINTKFEFAFADNGSIEVIGEVFTPDSTQFIIDDNKCMGKDILKEWVRENKSKVLKQTVVENGHHGVEIPNEISSILLYNYSEILNRCLSIQNKNINKICNIQIENTLENSLNQLEKFAVIIADSKSDVTHVKKIRIELERQDIISWVYYVSPHNNDNNTEIVMNILNKYETMVASNGYRIIYITLDSMSNVLNHLVTANTINPVIAYDPFGNGFQVNIISENFCKRIFDIV